MKILITGGAGFIGSNLVLWLRERHPDVTIVNLDLLTYAGNLENLKTLENDPEHIFVRGDCADREAMDRLFSEHEFEGVLHLAAESHVDRSILDATPFVRNNILGTQVLLDVARAHDVPRYLQVSTDEVYGALGKTGLFTEDTPLAPNSPYAASKAAADMLVRAAHKTHGYNTVITRCSNNYGALQFPEKLIPLMIANAVEGEPLPVYGDGMQIRDWLHVSDHCQAIWTVFEQAVPGSVYNVGGNNEWPNIDVVQLLLRILGKSENLIEYVQDRAGHDRRYAIDASKIRDDLGWEPVRRFEEALPDTVQWYLDNKAWWERVRSGAYREYYESQYGGRIGV
jgi:dTDP-glucose 4,6-dehydratase